MLLRFEAVPNYFALIWHGGEDSGLAIWSTVNENVQDMLTLLFVHCYYVMNTYEKSVIQYIL